MTAADGTKIAEDLQHSMNCSAWKDKHGHDMNGEDCTCGLRFRTEISTLRTLKAAWEKRAYEAEERERVLREAVQDAEHLCRWLLQSDISAADRSRVIRENGIAFALALATPAQPQTGGSK